MSKLIRQFLGEKDPRFSMALARLEAASGMQGIDARLTAEILSTTRQKITSLGLDPNDTTGVELYRALESKLRTSEEQLVAYLGHPAHIDAGATALVKLAEQILGKHETWSIKPITARKLIRDNPPKKVMKAFHYQSVDSMARRMDPAEVLMAARLVESTAWWARTKKGFSALSSKDFEKSSLRVVPLTGGPWLNLLTAAAATRGHATLQSKECATVGLLPLGSEVGYVTSLISVLHAINEVRLHGTFLKLHFVNPSIGNMLVHAIDDGTLIHAQVAGMSFHWRDVQRYYGLQVAETDRTFSHLDVHDLGWIAIETKLSLQIPDFAFWVGLDYCGVSYGDGKVISCNILDVAEAVSLGRTYDHMSLRNLSRAVRGELLARYLVVPSARAAVLKQFDISTNIEEDW
jgi:hypothetical protein